MNSRLRWSLCLHDLWGGGHPAAYGDSYLPLCSQRVHLTKTQPAHVSARNSKSSLSLSDCWHWELWGQLALGCPQNPLSQYPVPHFHTRLKQLAAALLMYPAEDWWLVWHIWALKVIETAASAHMAAEAGCAKSVAWAAPTSGKLAVINPQIWPAYTEPLIKTAGGWEVREESWRFLNGILG